MSETVQRTEEQVQAAKGKETSILNIESMQSAQQQGHSILQVFRAICSLTGINVDMGEIDRAANEAAALNDSYIRAATVFRDGVDDLAAAQYKAVSEGKDFTIEEVKARFMQMTSEDNLNFNATQKTQFSNILDQTLNGVDPNTMKFSEVADQLTKGLPSLADIAQSFNVTMQAKPTDIEGVTFLKPVDFNGQIPVGDLFDIKVLDENGNLTMAENGNDVSSFEAIRALGSEAQMCLIQKDGENIGVFVSDKDGKNGFILPPKGDGVLVDNFSAKVLEEMKKPAPVEAEPKPSITNNLTNNIGISPNAPNGPVHIQ